MASNVTRWSEAGTDFTGNACGFGVDSDDDFLYIHRGLTDGREQILTSRTKVLAAATTVTARESGTSYFLNAAAGFAITLPAPAAGLKFRFTTAAVFATTPYTLGTASGANILQGSLVVAGVVVVCSAQDTINFVETAEAIGDFVDVWSDGTSWFVFGNAKTTGAFTTAVT